MRRAERRATGEFLQVLGPAGVVVKIAGWMVDPVVCASMTTGAPRVDLAALIELRELITRVAEPAHFRGEQALLHKSREGFISRIQRGSGVA